MYAVTVGVNACTFNICLDETLTPHVADFGFLMVSLLQHGSSCLVTSAGTLALAGTPGYLAPEFTFGKLSTKVMCTVTELQVMSICDASAHYPYGQHLICNT